MRLTHFFLIMPLSYYKRPLFLALLVYIFFIILHKADFLPFFSKTNIQLSLPFKKAKVEGIINSYPQKSGKMFRFNVSVNKINDKKIKTGIIVYSDNPAYSFFSDKFSGDDSYVPGFKDKVLLTGDIKAVFSDKVPGNLDWKEYLKLKGINGKMLNPDVKTVKKAGWVFLLARSIHFYVLNVFDKKFTGEYSAILSGIVMGEKKRISKSLRRFFQDSGAMHLLVASGSNVGFIAFIVYCACFLARIKKGRAYILSLMGCGAYVLSAGLDPPLIRAYIMFMFALAGFMLGRESGVFQGLLISAFVILIYEPYALFNASFQMSFLATYGIIVGMANWNKFIKGGIVLKSIAGIFAVSLFAQLGLYPLMVIYFHKVSLISAFSNIIFVPFSGLLMTLGLLTAAFAKIPLFGYIISQATLYSLAVFKFFVVKLGGFDYSAVFISHPSIFSIIACYVIIFMILHMPGLGFKNKRMYAALAAALLVFLAGFFKSEKTNITLFSQGRYPGAFFKNADCGLIVLNAGIAGDKLARAVLENGYSEIDILLLSSFSENYTRGIKELSKNIKIKKLIVPHGIGDGKERLIFEKLKEKGTEFEALWQGQKEQFCGVEIEPRWGLHVYADGKFFRNTGYSGHPFFDRISWHLKNEEFDFEFSRFANSVRVYKSKKHKGVNDIRGRKGKIIKIDL